MRASFRLRLLRPEDESEDKVLRVRSATGLQEVLREVPAGAEETYEAHARPHTQADTRIMRKRNLHRDETRSLRSAFVALLG